MFIYKTTNLINGMIYIGKYQGKNKNYLGSGKYLNNAIKKYGRENFSREIIEDNITDSDVLCKREIFWIGYYDSMNPDVGYNLTSGGDGMLNPSPETREKMSENLRKRVRKPESIEKTASAHRGMKRSEESKKRMSEAQRGRKASEITRDRQRQSMLERYKNHPKIVTKPQTPEANKKRSEKLKGRPSPKKGIKMPEEQKKKYSIMFSGEGNPMYGKTISKESMIKKRINQKRNKTNRPLVFDCFMFFNELALLEIRINILKDFVDYFVIVESTKTFSNKTKDAIFEKNKKIFDKYKTKIIYVLVEDMPNDTDSWGREIFQRNAISKALKNCQDSDIVITSDLDEIPDLSRMSQWYREGELFHPLMSMYYYYLNVFKEDGWYGSKVCNWGYMKDISVDDLRNMKNVGTKLWACGWHFSFLNDVKGIQEKLGAFSHTEFDNDFYKSQVAKNVANNKDLFFRGGELQVVPIDDSFPPYIVNNQELLSKFIKKV